MYCILYTFFIYKYKNEAVGKAFFFCDHFMIEGVVVRVVGAVMREICVIFVCARIDEGDGN